MDGRKKKPRRALHIGVLLLGAYLLFLGGGTLLVNLTGLLRGNREWTVTSRLLLGTVFTGLGVYAVWDSVRDLRPRKEREEAPPLRFIFTGVSGVRSSNVTPELIREQIGRVAEDGQYAALEPATPLLTEKLVRLAYAFTADEGYLLIAVFPQGSSVPARRKTADAAEAEAAMTALLEGRLPDFSGWEPMEAAQRRPELKRRLVLVRDSGTNDHEFFTERDLDLAVTGLADGTYQKAAVQTGPASVTAVPMADGDIVLYLQVQTKDGVLAFRRAGMPNQVRFWLLQFYDGSLFQSPLEGWEAVETSYK
ncbi:MAG: hypothetical protein K2N78_05875 [Oscillospiraceae bacterium]|nr:hypothetical protein [Oscillospiraceae bacterium]